MYLLEHKNLSLAVILRLPRQKNMEIMKNLEYKLGISWDGLFEDGTVDEAFSLRPTNYFPLSFSQMNFHGSIFVIYENIS